MIHLLYDVDILHCNWMNIIGLTFQDMEDSVFYSMDTICDLVYLLDIFVHLRISFYEDGCLVGEIFYTYVFVSRIVLSNSIYSVLFHVVSFFFHFVM